MSRVSKLKERILFLFMTLVVLIPYGTPLVTLAETLDHSLTVTLASLDPSEAAKGQVTLSLSVDNQSDETQSVVLNSDQALTADQALSENLPTGVTAALVQEKQLQVTVAPKVKDTVKLVTSVKDSAAASVSFSYQAQKLTALLKDSGESATEESETTVSSTQESTEPKESSSTTTNETKETNTETSTEKSQPVQKKAAKAVMKAAAAPQAAAASAGRDITTLPHAKDLFDSKDGKTIFTTADLSKKVGNDWVSVDGKDIQLNDTLLLQYQWELPESVRKEMKAGDIFNFHLPEKFAVQGDKELTGQLVNDKGTVFGDFVIQKDGSVVITFTKAVETNSGIKGTLNVAGQVDQSKIDNPGDEDVTIPFTDDDKHVTPNIVVPNAQALSKEVATKTNDADIQNNQATVNWKITANKTGAPLTNGKLSESLPAGVTYAGNLKIQSYEVDLTNGSLKAGTGKDVAYDSSAIKNGASAFEINLPDTDHLAYVVSFDTTVDFGKIEKNDENTPPTAASPSAKVTNHVKLTSKENNDLDERTTIWTLMLPQPLVQPAR